MTLHFYLKYEQSIRVFRVPRVRLRQFEHRAEAGDVSLAQLRVVAPEGQVWVLRHPQVRVNVVWASQSENKNNKYYKKTGLKYEKNTI